MRKLALASSDHYELFVDQDPQTGNGRLNFRVTKPLPDEMALIIGDAIHNLKSALDIAVNEIVFAKTSSYSKHTRFPVYETRESLIAAMNGGTIKPASPETASLIVDVIKPYKGGNDIIWNLHELNIADKHRLLLPIIQVTSITDVTVESDAGKLIDNGTFIADMIGISISQRDMRNLKITDQGKATFDIRFDKILTPVAFESVFPMLRKFTEEVSSIVEAFEIALRT
jgi:hypothetical protein